MPKSPNSEYRLSNVMSNAVKVIRIAVREETDDAPELGASSGRLACFRLNGSEAIARAGTLPEVGRIGEHLLHKPD